MSRLIFLLALLPCILAFVVAKFFGARKLTTDRVLSVNGEQMAKKVLASLEVEVVKKKSWWGGVNPFKNGKLHLSEKLCESRKLSDVAKVLHLSGLVLLESVHPKSVKQRYRSVRFASVFPIFMMIAAVFTKLARGGRLPMTWFMVIIVGSLALACLALMINLAIEKEAAKRAIRAMEESNLVPKIRDQEPLEEAILGWAYLSLMPSMFHGFLLMRPASQKQDEQ